MNTMNDDTLMVSACLLGEKCRYNGEAKPNPAVVNYLKNKKYITVCPECAAGLPIPRLACEIVGGEGKDVLNGKAKVLNHAGTNLTREFISGSEKTLAVAKEHNINTAIFKDRSPSCGVHQIHTGGFDGNTRNGMGVCARLLQEHGITLYTEMDIEDLPQTDFQ